MASNLLSVTTPVPPPVGQAGPFPQQSFAAGGLLRGPPLNRQGWAQVTYKGEMQ